MANLTQIKAKPMTKQW